MMRLFEKMFCGAEGTFLGGPSRTKVKFGRRGKEHTRAKTLRLETLEDRQMLSVVPNEMGPITLDAWNGVVAAELPSMSILPGGLPAPSNKVIISSASVTTPNAYYNPSDPTNPLNGPANALNASQGRYFLNEVTATSTDFDRDPAVRTPGQTATEQYQSGYFSGANNNRIKVSGVTVQQYHWMQTAAEMLWSAGWAQNAGFKTIDAIQTHIWENFTPSQEGQVNDIIEWFISGDYNNVNDGYYAGHRPMKTNANGGGFFSQISYDAISSYVNNPGIGGIPDYSAQYATGTSGVDLLNQVYLALDSNTAVGLQMGWYIANAGRAYTGYIRTGGSTTGGSTQATNSMVVNGLYFNSTGYGHEVNGPDHVIGVSFASSDEAIGIEANIVYLVEWDASINGYRFAIEPVWMKDIYGTEIKDPPDIQAMLNSDPRFNAWWGNNAVGGNYNTTANNTTANGGGRIRYLTGWREGDMADNYHVAYYNGSNHVVEYNEDGTIAADNRGFQCLAIMGANFLLNYYEKLPVVPLNESMKLQSLPGSPNVIVIDGSRFGVDFNTANLTFQEKVWLQEIWQRVAEDFAPFNVNITTDPTVVGSRYTAVLDFWTPMDGGWRTNHYNNTFGYWSPVGGAGLGGQALGPSATTIAGTTMATLVKTIAEGISYAIGSGAGLQQASYLHGAGGSQPYAGHNDWGPIMGYSASVAKRYTQWSQGEYYGAGNTQDQIAYLTMLFGGLRPDTRNNHTINTATVMQTIGYQYAYSSLQTTIQYQGVIASRSQYDYYVLENVAGSYVVDAFGVGADFRWLNSNTTITDKTKDNYAFDWWMTNLNLKLDIWEIVNGQPVLVQSVSSIGTSFAHFTIVPPDDKTHTYYFSVTGVGSGNAIFDGFSDYGSLGQYTIRVTELYDDLVKYDEDTGQNYIVVTSLDDGNFKVDNKVTLREALYMIGRRMEYRDLYGLYQYISPEIRFDYSLICSEELGRQYTLEELEAGAATITLSTGLGSLLLNYQLKMATVTSLLAGTDLGDEVPVDPQTGGYSGSVPTIINANCFWDSVTGEFKFIDGSNITINASTGGTSSFRTIYVDNIEAEIYGVIITGGNAKANINSNTSEAQQDNINQYGGGIFNNYGWLTIANTIIAGNAALKSGGGIYNRGGFGPMYWPQYTGTEFRFHDYFGQLLVYNTSIIGNITTYDYSTNTGSTGGGVYNDYVAQATFINCTIAGNVAGWGGGGIDNNGYVFLLNSIVAKNFASRGTDIYTHAAGYYNSGGPGSARTFASYSIIGDANFSNDSDNGDPNRTLVPWDNGQKYGVAVVNTIGNTIGTSTTNIDGTRNNAGVVDPRFLVFSGRWVPWSGKYNANGYQLFQVVDASAAYRTGIWTIDLWQSWNLTITAASTPAIDRGTSGTATDFYTAGLYEYYYNYYYSSVYDKIQREILQLPGALWDNPVPPGSPYLQDQVDFYRLIYANNYIYDSASSVTNMVSRRITRLTTAPVGSGINSWTATIFFSEFTDWMVSTKYTDQNIYDYAQRVLGISNAALDTFLLSVGTGYTLPAMRAALRVTPTPTVRGTLETRLNTVYGATITGSIAAYRTNRIDFQASLGDTVLRNYWSNSYVYNSNSSVPNMAVRRNPHTGRPGYTPANPLISAQGMSSWTSDIFISEFLDWMVSTDYTNQDIYDYAWLMLEISQATLDAMFAQIGTIDVGGLATITINNLDDARATLRRTDTIILIGGIGSLMRNGTYQSIFGNLVDFVGMELELNNQFGAQIDADIATYRANRINFQKSRDIKAYYRWKYGTDDPSVFIAGMADAEAQALANWRIANLKDLAGNTRIMIPGAKIDIGAYEYQAGKIDMSGFQPRIINTETVDYDWSYTIIAGAARGDRTGMGIKVDENTYDNLTDPDYDFDASTITYDEAETALFLNFAFFNQGGATTAPITVNLDLAVTWDSENFKSGFPTASPWKYLSQTYDPTQYVWNNGAGVWNTTLLSFTITAAYPGGVASRLSIASFSAGWTGLHFVVGGITVANLAFPTIDSTVAQLVDNTGLVGTIRLFSNGMVMVEDLFFKPDAHSPHRGLYQFTMDLNPGTANKNNEIRNNNNVYSTIVQVIEAKTLVVDTTNDIIDKYDGFTSIREAILYASSKKEWVKNLTDGNIVAIGNKNYLVIGAHLYTITTGDFLFTTNTTPQTNGTALTNGTKVTLTANIPVLYQVHNTQTGQWDSVEVILNNGTELIYNSAGYFTSGTSRYKLYDNTALTIVVGQNVQNVWYSSINSVIATIASGTMIDFIYNPFNAKVNSGILQSVVAGYFAVPINPGTTKELNNGDIITLTTGTASVYRLRVNSLQYEMPSGTNLTLTFRDGLFYDGTDIYLLKPGQTFTNAGVNYTFATSLSADIVPAQRDRLVNKATGTVYSWREAVGSAVAGWYDAQDRLYTPIAGVNYEYQQGEYETITDNVTVYYKEGSTIRTEQFYGETVHFDSVVFADSSAVITLDLDLYGSLEIDRSITIDASVRYNKITGELDPTTESVVLSTTSDLNDGSLNHDRVVKVYSGANATLINLTITNGWADIGGGIYAEAGSNLLLIDCNVDGNRADLAGGGIYALGALKLIGGSVSNNKVVAVVDWLDAVESFYGGGIYYKAASTNAFLTIDGVTIADNKIIVIVSDATANVKVNAYGGGVYTNGSLELIDSQVLDNEIRFFKGITDASGNIIGTVPLQSTDPIVPNSYGGGLYAFGSVTIAGDFVQFINNRLDGDDSKGGAIYAGGSVTITGIDVQFSDSYAGSNGGAIYAGGGNVSITGDSITFTDNLSDNIGGAIYAAGSVSIIGDSVTFTDNSTESKGGAIYATGSVTITGTDLVELSDNYAGSDGGAIYAGSGSITITGGMLSFIDNYSTGDDSKGGTLYASGSVTIIGTGLVQFSGSYAGSNGGAIYAGTGDVSITGDSVTFTDNYSTGDDSKGGAIYAAGSVTITGIDLVQFSGSYAGSDGGAIYADTGDVSITGDIITFTDNYSTGDGGAIYAGFGDVSIIGDIITFTDNYSTGDDGKGGAIHAGDSVTITGTDSVQFSGSYAGSDGGAIYAGTGDVNVIGGSVLFADNYAGGDGGAIYAPGSVSVIGNTEFTNNRSEGDGGAVYVGKDIYLSLALFADNSALKSGGAVYAKGNVTIYNNSFFVGNDSKRDGGAVYAGGNVHLVSAFFTGNSAQRGGAVYSTGTVTIDNQVEFVGNYSLGDGGAIYATGSVSIIGILGNFSGNLAEGSGGAVYTGGRFTANRSFNMEGNTAGQSGGGIYALGDVYIIDSLLEANTAVIGSGGAIYSAGSVTIDDYSQLIDNYSPGNGGAIYATGSVTIGDHVEFVGNYSLGSGGAIYTANAVTIGDYTLFEDNHSPGNGGAIYATGSVTIGSYAEFTDNYSLGSGGAIYTAGTATIGDYTLFEDNHSPGNGGAIYATGSVTIGSYAEFTDNYSLGSGGAIYTAGSVTIDDYSLFFDNYSPGNGGAIYAAGAVAIGDRVDFVANNSLSAGGAIYAGGSVTIGDRGLFAGNNSLGSGGAIYTMGELRITGVSTNFTGNTAGGSGGAVYAAGRFIASKAFTLEGNSAGLHGGGIYTLGDVYIVDSLITANTAVAGSGGAIYRSGNSTLVVINSAFVGNSAATGGGAIASLQGTTQLVNVTIAGNLSADGGGLMVSGNVYLYNTIIAANYQSNAVDKADVYLTTVAGSTVAIYYSLIGTGVVDAGGQVTPNVVFGSFIGTVGAPLDPRFTVAPAFDPGTGLLTNLVALTAGGLVPHISSLAVDSGSNAYAIYSPGVPIEFDLLGKPRIYGPSVDMGAYEIQQSALCDLDISAPGSVIPTVVDQNVTLAITIVNNSVALASWKGALPYSITTYMKDDAGNWVLYDFRTEYWGTVANPQFLMPGQSVTLNYNWGTAIAGEYYFVVEVNPEDPITNIRAFEEVTYVNNIYGDPISTFCKVTASPTIYVNTTEDYDPSLFGTNPSKMSLREALYWITTPYYQNIGNITIKFDPNLGLNNNTVITVDAKLGALTIEKNVTIDASDVFNAAGVLVGITLNGANTTRIMKVMDYHYYDLVPANRIDLVATLKNLNFVGGNAYVDKGTIDQDDIVQSSGGAIDSLARGGLYIYNCSFTNNVASHGGAIRNTGLLTISDSTFTSNSTRYEHRVNNVLLYTKTGYNGGAISNGGVMTIDRSSFAGNEAGRYGGAIFQTGGMTIANSAIYGNKAAYGGGILVQYTATTSYLGRAVVNSLYNCTIAGNTGTTEGGGLWISSLVGASQKLQLVNSIVYGNSSPTGKDIYEQKNGVYDSISSQINVNPNFVNFNAANLSTWATWNLRLSAGSTMIGTGNVAAIPIQFNKADLVGNIRVNAGKVSVGAYEYYASSVIAVDGLNFNAPATTVPIGTSVSKLAVAKYTADPSTVLYNIVSVTGAAGIDATNFRIDYNSGVYSLVFAKATAITARLNLAITIEAIGYDVNGQTFKTQSTLNFVLNPFAMPAALPSLAAVNQISANSVYVRWNTTDASTDFRIRYKEIGSDSWIYVNRVFSGTSAYVSGQFQSDTTYIFQVQAIGDGVATKDSDWSDAQQVEEALRASIPGTVDLQGWSALQAVTFRFTGAQISSTMTSLASSQVLKLDVEATSLPSSRITGWIISWGDNTETRLDANTTYLSLNHFYMFDGDYTITVRVLDADNVSSKVVYTLGVFIRDTSEVTVTQLAPVGQQSVLPQEPVAAALPGNDFSFTQVASVVADEAETVVAPLSDSAITVDTVPSSYQRAEVEGKESAKVPGTNAYTAYGRYDQAFVDRWSRHLSRFSNRHLRSVQQNDILFQEGDMFDAEFGFEGTSPQVNSSLFTEDILEEILS